MNDGNRIEAMLKRRAEIAADMEKLKSEASEIDAALSVINRFGTKPLPIGSAVGGVSGKLGPPRPEGTPVLFEMAETVLKEAIKAGKQGLVARDLVAAIGAKYWPGVEPAQVMPSIYGYVKDKRLKKTENGVFKPMN